MLSPQLNFPLSGYFCDYDAYAVSLFIAFPGAKAGLFLLFLMRTHLLFLLLLIVCFSPLSQTVFFCFVLFCFVDYGMQ